jgi:HEPN domain-containing protein
MDEEIENIEKIIKYWLNSAEQNYNTMRNMLDSKDYSWALFLGHLVIEKTLKAIYVSRLKKHAIFSHDLLRLANKIGLELSNQQQEWLDEITTFNLNARYDNYKQDFHKLCTKEFATIWIERIETTEKWLKNQL